MIVPEAVILHMYYIIISPGYVTVEDYCYFFNPTRDAQAAVAFRFSAVVQLMGLAHYARLISASFGM